MTDLLAFFLGAIVVPVSLVVAVVIDLGIIFGCFALLNWLIKKVCP